MISIDGIERYSETWGLTLNKLIKRYLHSPECILAHCKKYNIRLRSTNYKYKILSDEELSEIVNNPMQRVCEYVKKYGLTPTRVIGVLEDYHSDPIISTRVRSVLSDEDVRIALEEGYSACGLSSFDIRIALKARGLSTKGDLDLDGEALDKKVIEFIHTNLGVFTLYDIAGLFKKRYEILEAYCITHGLPIKKIGIADVPEILEKSVISDYEKGIPTLDITISCGLPNKLVYSVIARYNSENNRILNGRKALMDRVKNK